MGAQATRHEGGERTAARARRPVSRVSRRRPPTTTEPPRDLTLRFPANTAELRRVRSELRRWLATHDITADLAADVVLAVNELATNAIEHGYRHDPGGSVLVRIRHAGDALDAIVHDDGSWADGRHRSSVGGRGLLLVRRLVDAFSIAATSRGTDVRFRVGIASSTEDRSR